MNTHKISAQSDNLFFTFSKGPPFALKIKLASKLEEKGGPFEKGKNKSCLIWLKFCKRSLDAKSRLVGQAPSNEI